MKSLLVTNPGSRCGDKGIEEIEARLQRWGELVRVNPEQPEDLPEAILEHGKQVDQIILGGGDGTVNLALDALLEVDRPLGLLPMGTANDLARSLNIPDDLEQALNIVLRGHQRRIDIAFANDVSFINAIGMGLGPQMTREMDSETKAQFGVVAYLVGIVRAFHKQRGFAAQVDGGSCRFDGRFLQITVANGIHYGGGMTVAEDAKIDDGLLDVLLVPEQSRLALLASALRFRLGQTRDADNLVHRRCKALRIETDPPLAITADGEFLAETPVECKVRRHALAVYTPE